MRGRWLQTPPAITPTASLTSATGSSHSRGRCHFQSWPLAVQYVKWIHLLTPFAVPLMVGRWGLLRPGEILNLRAGSLYFTFSTEYNCQVLIIAVRDPFVGGGTPRGPS